MKKVTSQLVEATMKKFVEAVDLMSEDDPYLVLSEADCDSIMSILEWAAERLATQRRNSQIYQKKASLVNKLIKEHLSEDELAAIDEQARKAAGG